MEPDQERSVMVNAAAEVVAAKDRIDRLLTEVTYPTSMTLRARMRCAWWQAQGWQPSGWQPPRVAASPAEFIDLALGFVAPLSSAQGPARLEQVDPRLVLGAAYCRYPPPTRTLLDELDDATRHGRSQRADYVRIGRLPLWVAREGKNRVAAYRQLGRPITAWVLQGAYPEPTLLALRRVRGSRAVVLIHHTRLLVRHDGDEFEIPAGARVLPFPKATVLLLEAYGVGWAPPLPTSWVQQAAAARRAARRTLSEAVCVP